MLVRQATIADIHTVSELLAILFEDSVESSLEENQRLFADPRQAFFLACDGDDAAGVAHGALRSEYVNGRESEGDCGYLEGIYILPKYRSKGAAKALVAAVADWAKSKGCTELCSDCLLENTESYRFHTKIGFEETERSIFFRMDL